MLDRKYLFFLFVGVLFVWNDTLWAQQVRSGVAYSREAAAIVNDFRRSMSQLRNRSAVEADDSVNVAFSPALYKLVGPGIYYREALKGAFGISGRVYSPSAGWVVPSAGGWSPKVEEDRMIDGVVDGALASVYAEKPWLFHYTDERIAAEKVVGVDSEARVKTEDLASIYNKVDEIKDVTDVVGDVDIDLRIKKPNFWKTSGLFELKFTQNYFSDNWYRGGNNNVTMFSKLLLEANYNDQKKLQWDNKLDLRLGFLTATSDSIHRYLSNNDKIYLFSKLGVKAVGNWLYTVSLEANTQFLPGHKSNDRRTYSKFMAPLDVFVSLGMDWKPKFKNGNTLSLALLPLTYKMRYISDDEETIHLSYNMRDKDFQQDFGSKVELNTKLQIVKNLFWNCRFYYFTSYEYVESEMENVLSFQFNKYISSDVNTLWRFDDNRDRKYYDSTLGFFQFKEFFTLGLTYKF